MQGTIDKRIGTNGRVSYRVRVESPDPVTGERRPRSETYKTRKEAEKRRREWVTEIENGVAVDSTKMTVAELFAQWLAVLKGNNLKPRTLLGYERTVAAHILPVLGATPVQKVQPTTIDDLYARLRAKRCSDDAIRRCHKRLRQAFDYAMKRRIIVANPILAVDAPTVRSAPPTILTVPQIRRFLTFAVADGYSPLWLLYLQTGMRRGEALGVRWSDIDFEKGQLRVRQSVESLDGAPHIQTPKSPAALRTITLFAESVAALKAHRTRQTARRLAAREWHDHDLVFTTSTGKPISPDGTLRNLRVILRKANAAATSEGEVLPPFHIHDFRHTHATHLLQEGWSVAIVARRLGHANPAITLSLYAHAITDVQGDSVATPAAFAFTETA